MADDARLSGAAREAIADANNEVLVSAASAWEIAIKAGLDLPEPPAVYVPDRIARAGFRELPVTARHALRVADLHHRDPFDRLLVAQASAEAARLVSRDPLLAPYGADLLW